MPRGGRRARLRTRLHVHPRRLERDWLVRTRGLCVLRQLRLEETLFRANDENWAIVNDGAPRRAIVLGISGKPHRLIDVAAAHEDDVLVIKRFTGGGTVVVDADTQFVSLVMNGDAIPNVPLFPRPLMRWTGDLYGGGGDERRHRGVSRPPELAAAPRRLRRRNAKRARVERSRRPSRPSRKKPSRPSRPSRRFVAFKNVSESRRQRPSISKTRASCTTRRSCGISTSRP